MGEGTPRGSGADVNAARIIGLDVARAVALVGMFASHVGDETTWPWLGIANGRSSALFAVMAGVSMALMWSRASGILDPDNARRNTVIKVATRGVLLVVIGWLVQLLDTPVDVIVDNLGVMFLLVLPLIGRRARWSWVVAALAIAGGLAFILRIYPLFAGATWTSWPAVHTLWSEHYPALAWTGYVAVGLALGYARPWSGHERHMLGLWSLALASASWGAGTWLEAIVPPRSSWAPYISMDAHSYSPLEMVHNVGCAGVVIAVSLWLANAAPVVVRPLAAMGAMTLTLYVAHLVVIAIVGNEMVYQASNTALAVLVGASALFAWGWRSWLGQGPLERPIALAARKVTDLVVRRRAQAGT